MNAIKAVSINVMGLRDNKKCRNTFQWLTSQNIDIIYLQERHIYQKKDIDTINNEWQGHHYWVYGSYHSAGVGIFFHQNLQGK